MCVREIAQCVASGTGGGLPHDLDVGSERGRSVRGWVPAEVRNDLSEVGGDAALNGRWAFMWKWLSIYLF